MSYEVSLEGTFLRALIGTKGTAIRPLAGMGTQVFPQVSSVSSDITTIGTIELSFGDTRL